MSSTNSSYVLCDEDLIILPASLDLILLGLGEDGHTASLIPGTSILQDHQRVVAATQSPKDPPNRLTMTLV